MVSLERQTITATTLARIPRRPGPEARRIYCRCTNWIGEVDGDWFFTSHKRREAVSALPARVHCEKCGRYTHIDKDTN